MILDRGLANGVLIPVATLEVGSVKLFVAEEKFCEEKTIDGVSIKWLGPNFKKNLLEKRENDVAPATLRIHGLKDSPTSALILAELGSCAEVTLAHFWELLKDRFSKGVFGKEGQPLAKNWSNFAFIRDKEGNLCVVHAHWPTGFKGLNVEAYSVKEHINQPRWSDRHQIVSL